MGEEWISGAGSIRSGALWRPATWQERGGLRAEPGCLLVLAGAGRGVQDSGRAFGPVITE